MTNYANGKIYKIVCNETGEQYIGSTTQTLGRRLSVHICYAKKNGTRQCRSKDIIDRGKYDIVLIEDYPCDTREQLLSRERHFIETLPCVNKIVPTRTQAEYYQTHRSQLREASKKYYAENPDKAMERKEYYKKWCDLNADKVRETHQKWRDLNADKVLEKQRDYYYANKEKLQKIHRQWAIDHRAKMAEYNRQYRLRKKAERESQLNHQK
jgi:hypothetical protein